MAKYIIKHHNELSNNEFEIAAMAIVRKLISNTGSCDIKPSVIHETYNNEYQKTLNGDRTLKAVLATVEKLCKQKSKF